MVEVPCRWRVGARLFRSDCRYRPTALGFEIGACCCISRVSQLRLVVRATPKSIVDDRA
jgi:hypothetical protein